MADINKMKRRLGIKDDLQNDLLQDLIDDAESAFKLITGATEVEPKYEFMVRSVALKLYARKGNEGVESENVDGYSVKYVGTLYDEYMDILKRDFDLDNDSRRKKGRVFVW